MIRSILNQKQCYQHLIQSFNVLEKFMMYFTLKMKLTILLICFVINYSQGKKIKLKYRKLMELEEKAKLAEDKQEDVSEGDEFKKRNLVELDDTIATVLSNPVRGQAETLIKAISRYTHALHRYIKKTNDNDTEAIQLGKAYIKTGIPKSFRIKVTGAFVNTRVGFDKYELQHYEYCREESIKSWHSLKDLLENTQTNVTTTLKPK